MVKKLLAQIIFSRIYHANSWHGQYSRSGTGSDLTQTATIRKAVPVILKEIGAKTLLDAPCGDFHWMQRIQLNIENYIGVDIVPALIKKNQQRYGDAHKIFLQLDIRNDVLPKADLIICRDCLVHLSLKDALAVINNFKKSDARYLLITTFPTLQKNRDIFTGLWRPLNLQLPPFHFSQPLKLINENCKENSGRYTDKSLGLWNLEDINI
ncbi:MAG: class I SAM-dependent methyltransferase [Patescibacteria group bacterium]